MVERAIPNKWAMVQYSVGVARHHKAIAIHCSIDNDFHSTLSLLLNVRARLLYTNVSKEVSAYSKSFHPILLCECSQDYTIHHESVLYITEI